MVRKMIRQYDYIMHPPHLADTDTLGNILVTETVLHK